MASFPLLLSAAGATVLAAGGVWLIWTARRDSRSRLATMPRGTAMAAVARAARLGRLSGAGDLRSLNAETMTGILAAAVAGGTIGWILFAAALPALAVAAFGATFPIAAVHRRQLARRSEAAMAWPRVLEEVRMRSGSLGRSIPQALWEAGRHVPELWVPAFRAAEREWLLTTDFERTLTLLRHQLDDPTADVVCETLLTAHELGGTDLDSRLADLIEDRVVDAESRRDADSRLAGVRFARRFVLLVPLGMTLAGLTIGTGRQAYTSPGGQLAVVVGVVAVAGCWWWSSRLMRLPDPPRIFR